MPRFVLQHPARRTIPSQVASSPRLQLFLYLLSYLFQFQAWFLINRFPQCGLLTFTVWRFIGPGYLQMASLFQLRRLHSPLLEALAGPNVTAGARRRAFLSGNRAFATHGMDVLDQSRGNRERVVILGSGWAGKHASRRTASVCLWVTSS